MRRLPLKRQFAIHHSQEEGPHHATGATLGMHQVWSGGRGSGRNCGQESLLWFPQGEKKGKTREIGLGLTATKFQEALGHRGYL